MTSLPSGYPTQSWRRGERRVVLADIITMPWNIIMYKCATKCPKILLKSLSYPIKYMGDPRYGKTYSGSRNPGSKSHRIPNNMVCVIRICRTHMFLGLPDPDPLVRDMDPDPDLIIKQYSKKTSIPTVLWILYNFFSLKNYVNVPQKVISKKFLFTPWRSLTKITGYGSGSWSESGSGSISQRYGSVDPHPDPYQNFLYPQHWLLHYQFIKNISDNSFLTWPGVFCFCGEVSNSWNLNDIGRNSLLGKSKKIAKSLMRTFTCHSTFLYDWHTDKDKILSLSLSIF